MTYLRPILIALALSFALDVTVFLLGGGNGLANSDPVTLRLVEGYKAVCTTSATLNQDNQKNLASSKTETTIRVYSDYLILDMSLTEEFTGEATKKTLTSLKVKLVNGVPTKVDKVITFSINGVDLRTHSDIQPYLDTFVNLILVAHLPLYGNSLSEEKIISYKDSFRNLEELVKIEAGTTLKVEADYFIKELDTDFRTMMVNEKTELRFPLEGMVVSSHGRRKFDLNTGLTISRNLSGSVSFSGLKFTSKSTENCSISQIKGYYKNSIPISDQIIEYKNAREDNGSMEYRLSQIDGLLKKNLITESEAEEKRRDILGLKGKGRSFENTSVNSDNYTIVCRADSYRPVAPFSEDVIYDHVSGTWKFIIKGGKISIVRPGLSIDGKIKSKKLGAKKLDLSWKEKMSNALGQEAILTYQAKIRSQSFDLHLRIKNDRIDGTAGRATGLCEEQG